VFEELDHGGLGPESLLDLHSPEVRRSSVPSTPWSNGSISVHHGSASICMKMHHEIKEELLTMKISW